MYTCRISENPTTPDQRTLLANITLLVAQVENLPIPQFADTLLGAIWLGLDVLNMHIQTEGNQIFVRTASKVVLLTITKVPQAEPTPALLIVDAMNDAGEPSDSSVVFGDTIEGASAALSYIQELKNGGDSNAVVATIHRQVFDPRTHIYHTQGDLVQQIDF